MTLNAETDNRSQDACEVAAYYFPQYHPDARNDAWHGKGWTEWELVKAARPRFPSHRQPIVPAWGYFDESDPEWAAREIDLAADHGVTCFLYDWYWYEDGPFLQDGLEKGFLHAPNNRRLKFALMWANHDWLNIHPANFLNRPETLVSGRVSREAFERLTDHVIAHYFSRPNYLTLAGEPYFSIYELGTFIFGLGGLGATRKALDSFRAKTRAAGLPGLHLNAIVWGVSVLPAEIEVKDPQQVVAALGFSSVTSYTWVHHYDPSTDGFPQGSYAKAAARNYALWEEYRRQFAVPYHPNVTMGWDPSPRTIQSDRYEPRGYPWTAVLEGNTPEAFREALEHAKAFATGGEATRRMITINAWNEWTEGSYLLPDTVHGTTYLKAVRDVCGR
ncbi:MAG TPA: glycoside hydrolase family 99-like domain-containing protein [Chthonomonadaceae bacterium]|nr:glycoside hydrolase family 99-like domain-containing protein [Chthonomonadaceae bacterium]